MLNDVRGRDVVSNIAISLHAAPNCSGDRLGLKGERTNLGDRGHGVSVLVTGGAGFVAATLVARLLERGESVLAVDNMSRGSAENLGASKHHLRLRIVVADIADLPAFVSSLERHSDFGPITSVWHLAANSDIPAGIADANVDLKDTFLTTFNVLEVMQKKGVDKLFFASSSAIYGDLGEKVLTEDIGPLFPI
jgi:UDP-glucose 4-epimerase